MTSIHSGSRLFVDIPSDPASQAPMQVNSLMAELQIALGYLEKKRLPNSARSRSVRRHARQSYNAAVRLLAAQSFSDQNRHHLEAQAAISKERLMRLGEKF